MSQCRYEAKNGNVIAYCILEAGHQGEHGYAEATDTTREHIALMNVSGALVDSGQVVPEDPCQYGEAVRKITARAEAAEAKLLAWLKAPCTEALAAEARVKALEEALQGMVDHMWPSDRHPRRHTEGWGCSGSLICDCNQRLEINSFGVGGCANYVPGQNLSPGRS